MCQRTPGHEKAAREWQDASRAACRISTESHLASRARRARTMLTPEAAIASSTAGSRAAAAAFALRTTSTRSPRSTALAAALGWLYLALTKALICERIITFLVSRQSVCTL